MKSQPKSTASRVCAKTAKTLSSKPVRTGTKNTGTNNHPQGKALTFLRGTHREPSQLFDIYFFNEFSPVFT